MNNRFEKYFQKQHDLSDCGPACLKMICNYYLQKISLEALREESFITKEGVSLLDLSNASEKIGFRTFMAYLDLDRLIEDCPFPAILHWNQNHFVVLFRIIKGEKFIIGDPAHGIVTITKEVFLRSWISTTSEKGTVLILESTSKLGNYKFEDDKLNYFKYLIGYVKPYKKYFLQLILGTLIASGISLILPFATKLLIDEGISRNSNSILLIIFLSQISLLIGSSSIEIIRGWLLLHINTRVSLNIISDFLIKLLRLPVRFFDTKAVGDLSQRINDHHRIDSFLSGTLVSTFFSIINILVFSIILYYFDVRIFLIFALCSSIGIVWVLLFQKKRKSLDYRRFERGRENQDKLYEMIVGMQEIKLYNSETSKRWEWERLQVKFFEHNMSALSLEQLQNNGFNFINTLKNIFISYVAAIYVIQGEFTLGTLLSISYIIGQTNGPIFQILSFIQGIQDAKLSFDRLLEIHKKKDEDNESTVDNSIKSVQVSDIILKDISFRYGGPGSPLVLNNINLKIPKGKVTAVVGTSGSGKTTLLKLLLGIYQPTEGQVLIGNHNLHKIKPSLWRALYGTVMQDGFIFHDTITRNVVMDSKNLDEGKFERAIRVSKIDEFVDRLPLGYTTKIGSSGIGLSGGQKQRILIGRAIYKDPDYLFFDEATSSLDANNERDIIKNLDDFFKSKTVVIIAHRLSTVKNADQIIVLKDGKLIEIGNHVTLAARKGEYYNLVHNQLELGV